MHWIACALTLARARAGSNMAARIAMMAMTTSSSIRVKPVQLDLGLLIKNTKTIVSWWQHPFCLFNSERASFNAWPEAGSPTLRQSDHHQALMTRSRLAPIEPGAETDIEQGLRTGPTSADDAFEGDPDLGRIPVR